MGLFLFWLVGLEFVLCSDGLGLFFFLICEHKHYAMQHSGICAASPKTAHPELWQESTQGFLRA